MQTYTLTHTCLNEENKERAKMLMLTWKRVEGFWKRLSGKFQFNVFFANGTQNYRK